MLVCDAAKQHWATQALWLAFLAVSKDLVGKAKQLTVSAASANLPAQEAARISERDDSAFKRKVIRESLSLDT